MEPARRGDGIAYRGTDLIIFLAVSSFAAGAIHAAVVPEHFEEEWFFGVFFMLAASFQIAWAIRVIFGRSVTIYATGVIVNGALIGIWVVSRTVGLPMGPEAWTPEAMGTLDMTAKALELILVAGSLALIRQRAHADEDGAGRDRLGRGEQPCA